MGFINKIKDILFEEVEDEEVKVPPKKEVVSPSKPIAERIEPQKKVERPVEAPVTNVSSSSGQVQTDFRQDNSFLFPDFDEEEFSNMSRLSKKSNKPTNVLEYEKKRKTEKKYDFGRYERIEKTEVVEKKKFKPSPIISPVYGVLNEDYRPEDIKKREDDKKEELDFNSVRKKAFEPEPKETYYEESVTVKLKEDEEKTLQKVKTIDELLEGTSDITIDTSSDEPKEEYEKIDEDMEVMEAKTPLENEDDTLESDLFDLIDSMYDSREDDE